MPVKGALTCIVLLWTAAPALANERVSNGDFSGGGADWTIWTGAGGPAAPNFNSLNVPTGGGAPGLEIIENVGGFKGGAYQALRLVPGQNYSISILSKDRDPSASHAFAEVVIGTAQPVNGTPYTGGNPPGTIVLKKWQTAGIPSCNNWDSGTGCVVNNAAFIATAPTMYLVLSCGQVGTSPTVDVAFDNVKVQGPDPCSPGFVNVIYVDSNAPASGGGTSWPDAYNTLDAALDAAENNGTYCDQIWVRAGTYLPAFNSADPRGATFNLRSHVAVYGGFNGFESSLSERVLPIVRDHTVLTNDATISRYVVTGVGTDGAVLDGFTIRASQHQSPECVSEFLLRGGPNPERDTISNNIIDTERDRYLDLDPDPNAPPGQRPILIDNRIFVTVRTEPRAEQGDLLELRTHDDDCGPVCATGAFQLSQSSNPQGGFADSGALEELAITQDARVTLTDRAGLSFAAPDAMYVRKLKLYPGAVLNTAHHRLYYQTLVDENDQPFTMPPPLPGRTIVDAPIPGYSLNVIGMNDEAEFACRVRTRVQDTPGGPAGSIQQQPIQFPPGSGQMIGVMDMDVGPANSVAAKLAFSRAGDEPITIAFTYRFVSVAPGMQLIVKLSADPQPGSSDNIEVARISPPVQGPGSLNSDRFATFHAPHLPNGLNLRRGVYVEIELSRNGGMGPGRLSGGDPEIEVDSAFTEVCPDCGDFNASGDVTEPDYLRLLAAYGQTAEGSESINYCLDLTTDHYIDLADLVLMDLALQFPFQWGTLCPPAESQSSLSSGPQDAKPGPQLVGTAGAVYVAGKETDGTEYDYIYSLDAGSVTLTGRATSIGSCVCPAGGSCMPNDPPQWPCAGSGDSRLSGRLVKDSAGELYQIHQADGLYQLTVSGVESRSLVLAADDQSYGGDSVHVGVEFPACPDPPNCPARIGIPLVDAVVRRVGGSTYVYALPVLVTPAAGDPYRAAAKILLTGDPHVYTVLNVYGRSTDPQDLWEIELHGGHVLVSASAAISDDRVLMYTESDTDPAPEVSTRLSDLFMDAADAPKGIAGMLASGNYLYLVSKAEPLSTTSNRLFRFKIGPATNKCDLALTADGFIDINKASVPSTDLGHITSIAENPADGYLWVTGLVEPSYAPNYLLPIGNLLFSAATLAVVDPAWFASPTPNPTAAGLTCHDLALPASIAFDDPAGITITGWRSMRTHTGLCALPIALNSTATGDGPTGPTVETRSGGIQRIEVEFSGDVSSPNLTYIDVSDGTNTYVPSSVSTTDNVLTINFPATPTAGFLPDEKCYTITLNPGAVAETITGDANCKVRALVGDTTGNGELNLGDALFTKVNYTQAASAKPQHDINLGGGNIDYNDMLVIKGGVTRPAKKALCP